MHKLFPIVFLVLSLSLSAQPKQYTVANAHSHNDYEKQFPFWNAYSNGFGSIEADIFLLNDELYVAHDTLQLKFHRTLDSIYLLPLQHCIQKNNGFVYSESKRQLQLLIDIKTDAGSTLKKLVEKLKSYPAIINNHWLKIVITGNRPPPSAFSTYPAYILFDGELNRDYPANALKRIVMMSDNLKLYALWNGVGILPEVDRIKISAAIKKSHQMKKKVRFWNAPDSENAWTQLIKLGVDFINTDNISGLAMFLNKLP
jgi:alkaline phosphatase